MDEELAVTISIEIDGEPHDVDVTGSAVAVKALLDTLGVTPDETQQAADTGETVDSGIAADSQDLSTEAVAP